MTTRPIPKRLDGKERALREECAIGSCEWLEREVGPVYDAMKADPTQSMPLNQAFDEFLGSDIAGIERGFADMKAGRVVPHDVAVRELQSIVDEAIASGMSNRSFDEIIAEAAAEADARGLD